MVDFKWYLNRQGVQGNKGEKGDKGDNGNTPTFYTGVNTGTAYTLIIDSGDGNTFETENLMPTFVNTGGTYLRLDTVNSRYVAASADMADLQGTIGEVKLATTDSVQDESVEDSDAVSYELFNATMSDVDTSINGKQDKLVAGANITLVDNGDGTTTINSSGGGGGGGSYTAGNAINISGDTISVKYDNSTIKLDGSGKLKADFTGLATTGDLAGKADVVHTHTTSDITDFPTLGALAGKDTVNYDTEVTNKPTIGNGTVNVYQNGTLAGSFTMNQTGDTTINLTGGGGGGGGTTYAPGTGIDISAQDVISVKYDSAKGLVADGSGNLGVRVDGSTMDFDNSGNLKCTITPGDTLPSQTGNSGKFLTTDGSATSWATVSVPTYSAGTGIDITSNTIAIDTSVVAELSDIPDVSHMVTDNTAQTISAKKTFADDIVLNGTKCVYYKNSANNECLMLGKISSNVQGYGRINVGYAADTLELAGKDTRPYYKTNGVSSEIALLSDVPDTTYMMTTNTVQDVSGKKTFTDSLIMSGINGIYYKNSSNNETFLIGKTGNATQGFGKIAVGVINDALELRGSGTRPQYWASGGSPADLALYSDIPTVPTNISSFNNDSGYITGITSSDVTTALGYTPYNGATNPNGYTSNTGTVTSVNNVSPVSGNVTISIPSDTGDLTNNAGFITSSSLPELATTQTAGLVQPDGTSITINNGVISAVGSAPNNMVTTDTTQTVSGAKTFSGGITSSSMTINQYNYGDDIVFDLGGNDGGLSYLYQGSHYNIIKAGFANGITVGNTNKDTTIQGDNILLYGNSRPQCYYNNNTYNIATLSDIMTGAAAGSAGTSGLVPQPSAGDNEKFLRGDGTWQTVSSGSSTDVQINGSSITNNGVANIATNNPITYRNVSSVIFNHESDIKRNGYVSGSYGNLSIMLGGTGDYNMGGGDASIVSAMADSSIMYAETTLTNGINIAGTICDFSNYENTKYLYALGKYINNAFFPVAWVGYNSGYLGLKFFNSATAGTTEDFTNKDSVSSSGIAYFSLKQNSDTSVTFAWEDDSSGSKEDTSTINTNGAVLATCTHVRVYPVQDYNYYTYTSYFGSELKLINPATNVTNGSYPDRYNTIVNSSNILVASYALDLKYDSTTLGVNGSNNLYAKLPTTFTGTDGNTAGTTGLVPAPTTSDTGKYLKSDGTWATVSTGTNYTATDPITITSNDIALTIDSNTLEVNASDALAVKTSAFVTQASLQTVHCVIDTYSSGTFGYREWDDGLIEYFGANDAGANSPVTLNLPYNADIAKPHTTLAISQNQYPVTVNAYINTGGSSITINLRNNSGNSHSNIKYNVYCAYYKATS